MTQMGRAVYAVCIIVIVYLFPSKIPISYHKIQTKSCKRHSHTNAHPNTIRSFFAVLSFFLYVSLYSCPLYFTLVCVVLRKTHFVQPYYICSSFHLSRSFSFYLPYFLTYSPTFILYTFNLIKSARIGIQGTYVNPVKSFHVFARNIFYRFKEIFWIIQKAVAFFDLLLRLWRAFADKFT